MKTKVISLALLFLLPFSVGCNRLKGDKGDTGATGSAGATGPGGPSGPSGENGQFFEFTGPMTSDGIVNIGSLSSDSLVAIFMNYGLTSPDTWYPHDGLTDYQAGTVTFSPFFSTWTYKIIVIHNPSASSSSLL